MKAIIPDDPKKNARLWRELEAREEDMVKKAEELAIRMKAAFEEKERLSEKKNKERQLRNIQEMAEQSTSWAEVELFIRYQAARGEIPTAWAQQAIEILGDLQTMARGIAQRALNSQPDEVVKKVHLELVRRVLGYTVRWHVWHAKGESQQPGGR